MYYNREGEAFLIIGIIIVAIFAAIVCFILWVIEVFKNGLNFKKNVKIKDDEISKLKEEISKISEASNLEIKKVKETAKILIRNLEEQEKENKTKIELSIKNLEIKEDLLNKKLNPTMIKIYDDYFEKYLLSYQNYFEFKKNPSYKSADYIKEIRSRYKELEIKNRSLELLLSEFIEDKEIIAEEKQDNIFDTEEKAHKYSKLNKEEWQNLSYIEKLDLIVQRYRDEWKNKLNIGLEYERYCGYLYEKKGYTVEYNGILKGKSDGGIDLIATNKNKKIYIQCKYWSINKQIRENTITQLFGSAFKMAMDDGENYNSFIEKLNSEKIRIVLLTKTELSKEAKLFCDKLNIIYKEKLEINFNYPIVKGVSGEKKIFYIPTDLQYDNIKYKSTSKEYERFKTCKDAEALGYRHCYKWRGK